MLKITLSGALSLMLLLCVSAGHAQNQYSLSDLEPGQLILNLSVSESTEVEQDRLTAVLQYTAQGRDKDSLQGEVNSAIRKALALLEDAEEVDYSTRQYQVYIVQAGRPARSDIENPVWRAQQNIELVGNNSGELLELAGALQNAGLHMVSMYYSVSSETHEEISSGLLIGALQKLQSQADEAAAALNKSSADLIEVSVNGNANFAYRGELRASMMAADSGMVDPPVAQPGKSEINVSVSARALLSP